MNPKLFDSHSCLFNKRQFQLDRCHKIPMPLKRLPMRLWLSIQIQFHIWPPFTWNCVRSCYLKNRPHNSNFRQNVPQFLTQENTSKNWIKAIFWEEKWPFTICNCNFFVAFLYDNLKGSLALFTELQKDSITLFGYISVLQLLVFSSNLLLRISGQLPVEWRVVEDAEISKLAR